MSDERFYPIDVHLLDTQTGERRIYRSEGRDRDDEPGVFEDFIWVDGNFACDCNRAQFFAEVNSEEDPDLPCGHERMRVERIVRISDGATVYEESA